MVSWQYFMCTWQQYILLLLSKLFKRCKLGLAVGQLFTSSIFRLIFWLVVLLIIENGVLMFVTTIDELSISPFNSVNLSYMYGVNVFINAQLSWWTDTFIIIKYLSLFLFILKSIFYDITKVIPALLWLPLTWHILFILLILICLFFN